MILTKLNYKLIKQKKTEGALAGRRTTWLLQNFCYSFYILEV